MYWYESVKTNKKESSLLIAFPWYFFFYIILNTNCQSILVYKLCSQELSRLDVAPIKEDYEKQRYKLLHKLIQQWKQEEQQDPRYDIIKY